MVYNLRKCFYTFEETNRKSLACLLVIYYLISSGIYYEKEWAEDKEIMKQTMPSADNLDVMATEPAHTEL